MELIQKIRAEIERQIALLPTVGYSTQIAVDYIPVQNTLNYLLSFLSTIELEEPTLTWGDVQLLDTFILECAREEREGKDWGESEEFYTEVLRRYNNFVKRTIPEIVSKIHEYNENDRKDSPEN